MSLEAVREKRLKQGVKTSNLDLPVLPDDRAVLQAVADLAERFPRRDLEITANRIARQLGIVGSRRHGRGAVAKSWTGTMSSALRISPRLRSLVKRGLLWSTYDEYSRHVYGLTTAGEEFLHGN